MTEFKPINDDHAIERVAFVLRFSRAFERSDLDAVRRQHKLWLEDLPAIREPRGFVATANADQLQVEVSPAIEFATLRPDGSPVWALRILGPEVTIECTRYTRWVRVWAIAQRHIEKLLNVVTTIGDITVQQANLAVVDAFVAHGGLGDFDGLLKKSDLIPHMMFDAGPDWHVHTGRFMSENGHRTLSNINIDVAHQEIEDGASVQITHRVGITHVLSADWVGATVDPDAAMPWLVGRMDHFHSCNKAMLEDLLDQGIQDRIGLLGEKK